MSGEAALAHAVEAHYGLGSLPPLARLTGGYANDVFRAGELVIRRAPPESTAAGLAYEHRLVAAVAARVPEVDAPLRALDETTFLRHDGCFVSVWPWIPGVPGRRRSLRLRRTAGSLLARIHLAGLEVEPLPSRPGQPSLRDMDWRSNRLWDLDAARRRTTYQGLEQAWEELGRFVQDCRRADLLCGFVHGDYYPGNVIALRGRAVGVVDWEEAKAEWLVWELARSVWEFAKDKRRHDLRDDRAGEFLGAYRAAGGPVPPEEERLLVPIIRIVRLTEALAHLTAAAGGRPWDPRYTAHNLRSLENLGRRRGPDEWLAAAERGSQA